MSANPRQFPLVFNNVRRALLRRFPYSLFFIVEGETLLVIACFHASRDPLQWQKRT
jgi:toxin ParE1/3/4